MATHDAEFRLTVYADEAMTTPLTPASGAPHSDPFQVATTTGVTGFQPYLYYPRGRQASLNPRSIKADTAKLTAQIIDQRTSEGGSNLKRWVTAFVGDDAGKPDLGGHMAQWEISTDGGSTWENYFTGRVTEPALDGRPRMEFTVEGMNRALDAEIFVGEPHASVDYAFMAPVWPVALTEEWAGVETKPRIPTTADIGGTLYANKLVVDESAIEGDMASRNIVTRALKEQMLSVVSRISLLGVNDPAPGLLVLADNKTTGESGAFYVTRGFYEAGLFGSSSGHLQTERTEDHHHRVTSVGVTELPASHPKHIPLPSDGDEVEIAIQADRPASEQAPLLIDDVHPVRLMRDIADGYFSHLNDDGTPQWSVPRDSTAQGTLDDHVGFANLIADESFHDFRGVITETREVKQLFNEVLGQVHRVGRRWNGAGQLVPVDMRVPESSSGLETVGNADLDAGGQSPDWRHSRKDAVTMVAVTHYVDEVKDTGSIRQESAEYPNIRPAKIVSREVEARVLDVGDPSLGVKEMDIDAISIRSRVGEGTTENQDPARRNLKIVQAIAEQYRVPYGRGPEYIDLPLRRTSTVEAVQVGDTIILDVDEIPDPETSERGGARVVRVAGLRDDAQNVQLSLVDQFSTATAAVPTVGNPSASAGEDGRFQVEFDVTLNGDGDPARVEVAITPQSTNSRPAEASSTWQFVEVVDGASGSTHTVQVEVPAGQRVWPRARSVPDGKAPSDWAYPSTPSADSDDLASITDLSHSEITGSSALATWNVGDGDLDVVVQLRNTTHGEDVEQFALPPGTSEHEWRGLDNGDSYRTTVWQRGPSGEAGPTTSATFTAGASNETAPTLLGLGILYGRNFQVGSAEPGDRPTGLIAYVLPRDSSLPAELEIAPDDGSGGPDTASSRSVVIAPGEQLHTFEVPMDGESRFVRGRHIEDGVDPSDWTAWHEGMPRKLPSILPPIPEEPTVDADVHVNGDGDVQIYFDGSPVVRSYVYKLDTTGYEDPAGGTVLEADSEGDATVEDAMTISRGETAFLTADVYMSDDGTGNPIASIRDSVRFGEAGAVLSVRLRAEADGGGVRDLHLDVDGPSSLFDADWEVYQDDPTGTPIASGTISSPKEVGPTDDAALNDISLPKESSLRWWAKVTDASGTVWWAFTSSDRDKVPNAWVTPHDLLPKPSLEILYDEDVEEIVVTVPSGETKTWSGLSGGGEETYEVSTTQLDDSSTEDPLDPGEERGDYVVEVSGGGRTQKVFKGTLRGAGTRVVKVDGKEGDFDSDGTIEGRAIAEVIRAERNFDIRFETRQGITSNWTTAGSATGLSKGQTAEQDVETVEDRQSYIRGFVYEAGHLDSNDHLVDAFGPLTFDRDKIPETSLDGDIRDDGTPTAEGTADVDGEGGKVRLRTATGVNPTADNPDGSASDVVVDLASTQRRWDKVFSGVTVPKGERVSIKARMEDADGNLAPEKTIESVIASRGGTDSSVEIEPSVDIREKGRDPNTILYDVKFSAGADVDDPNLRWRSMVTEPGETIDFGDQPWNNLADQFIDDWLENLIQASRSGKFPKMLRVQVQDQAPETNPTGQNSYPVSPNLAGLDDDDGSVDPDEPYGGDGQETGETPESQRSAERKAMRAAQMAVRDYLGEEIDLGRLVTEYGSGKAAVDVMDEAGVQKLLDSVDRKLRKLDLDGAEGSTVDGQAADETRDGSERARGGLNGQGQLLADVLSSGGFSTLIDTSLSELDSLEYGSGVQVDSLEPAESGSDVTGQHTSQDTDQVDGQPSSDTRDGAERSRSGLNTGGQLVADVLESGGVSTLIDTSLSEVAALEYSSGVVVDQVEPAEGGADVTGQHTSQDTDQVSGTAASTVEDGAGRANSGLNATGQLLENVLIAAGTAVLIDTGLEEIVQLAYSSGALIDDLEPAEGAAQRNPAAINAVAGGVGDDGTDDTYNASWTPGDNVSDSVHRMLVDYYDAGIKVQTNTVLDPVTTQSDSHVESGAGGDPGSDHKIRWRLQSEDDQGNWVTRDVRSTSLVSEDTSGGSEPPEEPL